jgi:Iron-containing redox enzyme
MSRTFGHLVSERIVQAMEISYLTTVFDIEAEALDMAVRTSPSLKPFFSLDFTQASVDQLRESYLRFLKVSADYVQFTVPMLRACGEALRQGDDEDRAWSELILGYGNDETDGEEHYGHHIWARDDMTALGANEALLDAPPHPSVVQYGKYFVEGAKQHPYAVLGVKGVLEHLSIRMCDDLIKGLLESRIPNAEKARSFFHHHGVLDIDHVRAGDKNLERLRGEQKRAQILEGAYFAGGAYRTFLRFAL